MKILLTGGNGYIAGNLIKELSAYNLTIITRQDLNLCNSNEVDIFFKNKFFDVIIHTASSGGSRLLEDEKSCVYNNLAMIYNLMNNFDSFSKIIYFGSGAEFDRRFNINENSKLENSFPIDPYGMYKNIIAKTYLTNKKFYNIRIFNVFNENELPTRMIKNNILNYLNKNPIIIHQNKIMDFFYMKDLIKIIHYYINNDNCPKNINCSYKEKYSLLDISNFINTLSKYKVDIIIENDCEANTYYGKYNLNDTHLQFDNLLNNIKDVYMKLIK